MKHAITSSCGKNRGCWVVITLPYDSRPGTVLSGVHEAQHDLPEILSLAHFALDKEPAAKKTLEKMAA